MGRKFLSVQFASGTDGDSNPTGYISDFGQQYSIRGRFIMPADIALTQAAAIAAAVGGTIATETSVCSDSNSFDARRLYFYRENGGSMSVPVRQRNNVIAAATAIKTILDAGTAGGKVVCIKLEGESFTNLNDELGVNYTAGNVGRSHKTDENAPRQYYFTGGVTYQSDVPFGNGVIQSIRSITNNQNAPASKVATIWNDCVGDVDDIACGNGRRNPRAHRRYILTHLTQQDIASNTETPESETFELPVTSSVATEIKTCGENAAALPGLICIGYQGESYDRVHRLI